jgi:hypothetical protein
MSDQVSRPKRGLFPRLSPPLAGLAAWVVMFGFVAITSGLVPWRSWESAYELSTHARTTPGTVTNVYPNDHDGCSYAFTVGESTYSKREGRCGTDHKPGDSLAVTYVPSHPQWNTSGTGRTAVVNLLAIQVGAPTLMASLLTLAIGRQRRLPLSRGAVALALVGLVLFFAGFA